MPIRVLSEQLASQIAAGEVVERPASVVKELIENALDAGATTINVEVRGGGRQLVQVADDGQGIPADELELAFLRHATSKLATAEELQTVSTLGFRGEALASIAAVSQVTAVSRAQGQSAGARLTLEGGHKAGRETVGAPQGTVIAVANLFYNVPARLKFLKSVTSEKRLIDEHVTRYALAYPGVRFRLSHDNRITFQSSGSGQLTDVLTAVYGPDTAKQLLPLESDLAGDGLTDDGLAGDGLAGDGLAGDGPEPTGADAAGQEARGQEAQATGGGPIRVSGYVGPPSLHRSNRNQIILYVNGRWIRDNSLTYAVIQAYHTLLPSGRFPMAIIFLQVPAESVDVNVHPAKTEVRFRRANSAFGAVQRAVRRTIVADSPVPHAHFASLQSSGWSTAPRQGSFSRREETSGQANLNLEWPAPAVDGQDGPDQVPSPAATLGGQGLPIMRVVGQVGAAYIIAEGPEGLYLIDQHAAHERILFEQFMDRWSESAGDEGMIAQGLVNGTAVHVSPAQATLLTEQLDLLARLGFQVEPFGPDTFMVRSIPALLTKLDPARALLDVVDELESDEKPLQSAIEARIILRVCKSAAVKAGQNLTMQEMEAMVRQLEQCASPHTCPHGRPTLIHLSAGQLAREFGRT